MKFRARMTDAFAMKRFSISVTTLSKLGKQCMLRLSPTSLSFVIFEDGLQRKPVAWCTLQQNEFFSDYKICGESEENNDICLQFPPEMLAKVVAPLKISLPMRSMKMKLMKKYTRCLTCEIEMMTVQHHSRTCIHDIPVEIVPMRVWSDMEVPRNLSFDLIIHAPNMRRFKTACEKMKTLANHMTIEGSNEGVLALKTEKDLATITTYFKDLAVENAEGSDPAQFSVKVDSRKVISFLGIEAMNPEKILCNILDKKLLFMNVHHKNIELNFFIPGISN